MFILLLAALLLLLLGWNIYYRRHWYRQVDVTLDFDRTSVYAGEQVELTEVITNRKKLPLPVPAAYRATRSRAGSYLTPLLVSRFRWMATRGIRATSRFKSTRRASSPPFRRTSTRPATLRGRSSQLSLIMPP